MPERKVIKHSEFPNSGDEFQIYEENGGFVFEHGKTGMAGYQVAEKKSFKKKPEALKYFKKHTACVKVLKVV